MPVAEHNTHPRHEDSAAPFGRAIFWLVLVTVVLTFSSLGRAEDSQGGTLAGRVTLSEQGLPGVTVRATGPIAAQAVAGFDGTYRISGLPPGPYILAVRHDGLDGSPAFRTVGIQEHKELSGLDFVAIPAAPAVPKVLLTPSALFASAGDTFTLHLTLIPGTQEQVVDVYLLFLSPGAALNPPMRWQRNVSVTSILDVAVLSYTLTGSEAPGTYAWLAFLTRPGTTEPLGPTTSASVTVQP